MDRMKTDVDKLYFALPIGCYQVDRSQVFVFFIIDIYIYMCVCVCVRVCVRECVCVY